MESIIKINLIAQIVLLCYFLFKEYIEKMITIDGLKLLLKIRKIQRYEDGNIYINFKEKTIRASLWNDDSNLREIICYENERKFEKTLNHLEKYNWISFLQDLDEEKVYTANHQSWHLLQIVGWCFLKSVLIPIIVSVLTTLIVLMLEKVI